jgi:excisionase family DNA binding protein
MTTPDQALAAPARAPLLSVKAAAELLGVSDSTVRRLVRAGELRPLRIGVQLRFAQEELERYAAERGDSPRGVDLPRDAMETPVWAEERVQQWKQPLEELLGDPAQTQVIVIDRRGAKAFSMLRPSGFTWGVNVWHSTAICVQSDAELLKRFEGRRLIVFEEMVRQGREAETIRGRLAGIGLEAHSVALIRRRSNFLRGHVADPHLIPLEDLGEPDFVESVAFISRLFDYCEPPLDPEHVVVSAEFESAVTAGDIHRQLKQMGIGLVAVVWNHQSIEDSRVAAVTVDRPQFFDAAALPLPDGISATWDGPCKIRIYISADGRRVTISFITFPTLVGDSTAWQKLIALTHDRYCADRTEAKEPRADPIPEDLERAYVDVCTDLSLCLLRQTVLAEIPAMLSMKRLQGPTARELHAFYGPKRGAEMHKQVLEALRPDERPQLRLPPKRPVPMFVDVDRTTSFATDPESAQREVVRVLPSSYAVDETGAPVRRTYAELLRALRPVDEAAVSNGLDGLLDGVRAKPVNVVRESDGRLHLSRGFVGSEIDEYGPYDAREMRRTQAHALHGLHQWLGALERSDETEIHVAKLLVNLVHDWGQAARPLAIQPYPYKHGYMPGVDSKVPWRTEAPKYFLRELADANLVRRKHSGRSYRYSVPAEFDLAQFAASAGVIGHERTQVKALLRAYTLIQQRCRVTRRQDPEDAAVIGTFSDPLIVLSSARNEKIAYACALFEVEDWVRTGHQLFEALNAHVAVEKSSSAYRAAIRKRVIPFAQAARFLFEKLAMYEAVPELRKQLVALFEQEGIDAGDILLETIDADARFAESYLESDHPLGLLRGLVPVLRGFSSFVRQSLSELGIQDVRPAKVGVTNAAAEGVSCYAERLTSAVSDPRICAAVRRTADAMQHAHDREGEAQALEGLHECFELIVARLTSQIKSEHVLADERGDRDEEYGELINIAKRLDESPHLHPGAVVAVGDFYNFMNVVTNLAEMAGTTSSEIAATLREKIRTTVDELARGDAIISQVTSDTCVLVSDDADALLDVVQQVGAAFTASLSWDSGLVEYMRFGIEALDHGDCLNSMVRAMKLGDSSGFRRGTVALTSSAFAHLGDGHKQRCNRHDDHKAGEVYLFDEDDPPS